MGDSTVPTAADTTPRDASRGEVILYALGNIEATVAQHFVAALHQIMIVVMLVNPLLLGLIQGIKMFWDAVTDPVMAYITDNTRSRWGRRRPYILAGGVGRMVLLVLVVWFFPRSDTYLGNRYMETDRKLKAAAADVRHIQAVLREAYEHATDTRPAGAAPLSATAVQKSVQIATTKLAHVRAELPPLLEMLRTAYADKLRQAEETERVSGPQNSLTLRRWQVAKVARQLLQTAEQTQARAAELPGLATSVQILLDGGALSASQHEQAAAILAVVAADEAAAKAARTSALQQKQPGFWQRSVEGWNELRNPANVDQRRLIIYVLIFFLLFTTASTVIGIPYFALGIELSPSYDGRTQVAVYRAVTTKIAGLLGPWVPFFCYLTWFDSALDGLTWFAILAAVVGTVCIVAMVAKSKERTQVSAANTGKLKMGFWKSIWVTLQSSHFWRIFLLYKTIGLCWGVFMQFGTYLNIYWVMGSAITGAWLAGILQTMAWATTFAALPLVNWGCRRYQKHNVVQVAVILMSIGAVLQWWTVNPRWPYLQLIMPFFTSVGIASFYVVMGTLLADVTDADELKTGERREGMYSAVLSFVSKLTDSFTPILAGLMLVVAGFDPALEFSQTETTIRNMRLLYTFVPGVLMLSALLLLWRYPLTRAKMEEIKAILKQRHESEAAAATGSK